MVGGAAGGIGLSVALLLVGEAASKGDFKGLSQGAQIRKEIIRQQAAARAAPLHSALVRAKRSTAQDVKGRADRTRAAAKAVKAHDTAKAKQVTAPSKQLAQQDKKALRSEAKKAAAALAPAKSALVRRKTQAAQNLHFAISKANQVGTSAATVLEQDAAVAKALAKKATTPVRQVAGKDIAALKKAAGADKKAAVKALAPTKSALVRQKNLTKQRLQPVKSTIGRDLKGMGKEMSGARQAVKASKTVADVKKGLKQSGAVANRDTTKAANRVGQWLAGGRKVGQ